jgi:cell division protein FtsW
MTFMDPSKDPTGSGYQIQQSLIAVGSGGIFGRGFGQSIQKFNFLPEPIGDSIFAVAAEEFGFVGSSIIVLLYLLFTLQGYRIAVRAQDLFGTYLVVGIITLIIIQSYLNISAMLAITPLSGTPLLFISHGGTALFFALSSVGIVLNVSKYQKRG